MTESALDKLGGEDVLRDLVEHLYDLMEVLPETEQLRVLHMDGHGIKQTRKELISCQAFWVGASTTWKNIVI